MTKMKRMALEIAILIQNGVKDKRIVEIIKANYGVTEEQWLQNEITYIRNHPDEHPVVPHQLVAVVRKKGKII